MSNVNALMRELASFLGASYYYDEAPDTATYPYRVGTLTASFDDEVSEVWAFELDYWGETTSALNVLIEQDAGDGRPVSPSGLNKRRFLAADLCASAALDSVLDVRDPDTAIKHKRASYMIRLYHK